MTTPGAVHPRDLVWPMLEALRGCTTAQLGYYRRPVATFPIVWGDRPPPADNCACKKPDGTAGSAWIRVVPQRLILDPRLQNPACAGGWWTHDLEIGIYRCWPTTADPAKGTPPSEAQYTKAARGLYQDAAALRRVPGCCTWLTSRDLTPTTAQITAIGPSGGCVAVVLGASFRLDECACPNTPLPPAPGVGYPTGGGGR